MPPARTQAGVAPAASTREGKAKLLLDVPRLELDAPVQVHREAGADEERLDDRDGDDEAGQR